MKLYQTYTSPFPTRVRLLIYAKGLDVEMVEPPGFHTTTEAKGAYLAINPIGRIPTLVLDDGRAIPESEVICEYLEDAFPEPSLRPADPVARATMRTISRICDFYLVMAMVPLFDLSAQRRSTWDLAKVRAATDKIAEALGFIEHHIGAEGYAVGRALSQADGALLPQLQLAYEWAPTLFGTPNPLGLHPKLAAYWQNIARDPIAARLLAETRDAVAEEARRARAAVSPRS